MYALRAIAAGAVFTVLALLTPPVPTCLFPGSKVGTTEVPPYVQKLLIAGIAILAGALSTSTTVQVVPHIAAVPVPGAVDPQDGAGAFHALPGN